MAAAEVLFRCAARFRPNGRIRERGLVYWADPGRRRAGEINHNDGGRGVYWEDPDGHFLEIITRPYGSGG